MSATATTDTSAADVEDDTLDYRSVSTLAVLGLLLGVFSVVTVFTAGTSFESTILLAPIPIVGLFVSLLALKNIAGAPDLYTGKPLALAGAVLSAFFLVGGMGYAGYVYATEVPGGYERTSFIAMKPTDSDKVNGVFIPDEIKEYIQNGEPIFIKGYIRPDSIKFKKNLNNFLLVRDNQQCCFGDLSKVQFFDQIQVQLGPGMTTDYYTGIFRLGGVLKIGPGDPSIGTPITYVMDANYVKP